MEVKSFGGESVVHELAVALGQFVMYRAVIDVVKPARTLFLAVTRFAFEKVFSDPLGELVRSRYGMPLAIFDADEEVIRQWLP